MSCVDLHLHLLPGIDDGPRNVEQSLRHAEKMAAAGVREATATPHVGHPRFAVDPVMIPERTEELQGALDAAGIPLRLHPGGEINARAATSLHSEQLDAIAHGPPAARWVLLETPFAGVDDAFALACRHIRDAGFGLVIAHPERARDFAAHGRHRLAGELAAGGALLQVNVCSLLGAHGALAQASAVALIRSGQAHVLASDGHGGARAHTLDQGERLAIAAGATRQQARRLVSDQPRQLLREGIPAEAGRRAGSAHAVAG